ncbi:hypothetical protein WGT02_10415 [Rhizobium sp. T1470]|uniref:hypothetical protein n=1 Tax=unclassified Rhizobium TaxID=2613769 RepID=UPI001AAFDCCD|nr:hypothetical protein [Rhizobium sp. T1473]MCA0801664.1 hypothetical protein [Rhizobium sp. T1473]
MADQINLPPDETDQAYGFMRRVSLRLARGAAYAFIALLLILASGYEMHRPSILVLTTGAIGMISARLGLAALFLLLALQLYFSFEVSSSSGRLMGAPPA